MIVLKRWTILFSCLAVASCSHARHTPESRYTTQPAHQLVYIEGDLYLHFGGSPNKPIGPFAENEYGDLKFEDPPDYYHHVSQSNGKWFYSHSYLHMKSVPVDATELLWE